MSDIVFSPRCSNCGALILVSVSVYKPIKGPEQLQPKWCSHCGQPFQRVVFPRTKEVVHYEKDTSI